MENPSELVGVTTSHPATPLQREAATVNKPAPAVQPRTWECVQFAQPGRFQLRKFWRALIAGSNSDMKPTGQCVPTMNATKSTVGTMKPKSVTTINATEVGKTTNSARLTTFCNEVLNQFREKIMCQGRISY